jgi:hypothetical protein
MSDLLIIDIEDNGCENNCLTCIRRSSQLMKSHYSKVVSCWCKGPKKEIRKENENERG